MRTFARDLANSGMRRLLWLELRLKKHEAGKLGGCGMIVLNPPYGFAEEAKSILGWLKQVLSQARRRCASWSANSLNLGGGPSP